MDFDKFHSLAEKSTEETISDALDMLYEGLERLYEDSRFNEIPAFLSKIEVSRLNLSLLIGLLSFTRRYRQEENPEKDFVRKVVVQIKTLAPSRYANLMRGLVYTKPWVSEVVFLTAIG
jgi:hypothetical protein